QIDTTNILFICGGAFVGLDKIVEGRMNSSSLGFNADIKTKVEREKINILKQVQPADLVKFGLIPELVGRLPVYVSLDELDENAFVKILTEPKNALVKQYTKLFNMDGIELQFTEEAVRAVAKKAKELKTGARGLRAIVEESMKDVMFDAPSQKIEKITITEKVIQGVEKPEVVYKVNSEAV
ncbi:MAG: AAA family ATPase, partial [Firmicutes bacterium]|nr:AAA family ATPase [Bacillota bacterium]